VKSIGSLGAREGSVNLLRLFFKSSMYFYISHFISTKSGIFMEADGAEIKYYSIAKKFF
jgi:hypothetical protein